MQKWIFVPVHTKMLDLLAQELKDPPRSIIDVGCGTGRLLRAALGRWPEAQLYGVDTSQQMLSEAKRLSPRATFQLAAAESLPFPDQTADVVLTSLSFHHWADQVRSLQEIARVLRPGGLFCLADHTLSLFRERARSRKQIQALVNGAGLAVRVQQRVVLGLVLITVAQKAGTP